jgi:hypothetical protein
VHGNCSFSNIMVAPNNAIRFLGMKATALQQEQLSQAQCQEEEAAASSFSLSGDALHDHAMLLASLLGFDELQLGLPVLAAAARLRLLQAFAQQLRSRGVSPAQALELAISHMMCTLASFSDSALRESAWRMVTGLLAPAPAPAAPAAPAAGLPQAQELADFARALREQA